MLLLLVLLFLPLLLLLPLPQVVDVNILRKPDGRMVGCAFVEFRKVIEATKAIKVWILKYYFTQLFRN